MRLIYFIGLLVVLVTADLEDKPMKEPCEVQADEQSADQTEVDSEYGDKFEGDMILPNKENDKERFIITGIINTEYRWPKLGGLVRVPYVIDSEYTTDDKNIITEAMNELQSKTCIKFNPRTIEPDYLHIVNKQGCWSHVGKQSGRQELSLKKPGCIHNGTIVHELIHALGFGHQHSHYQRDEKLIIHWDNIDCTKESNFEIRDPHRHDNFGTDFDISSIMHYGPYAFSKNNEMTIEAKSSSDQGKMGQRSRLSIGDITRIKNMYGC